MKIQTVRRGFAMVAILAVTGVTGVAVASPASALAYDDVNPASSICFKDRKIVKQVNIYSASRVKLGNLQLLYSPSCRTTWARVETSQVFSGWNETHVSVTRNSDKRFRGCNSRGAKTCNTAMLNDAGVTSYAHVYIWYKGGFTEAITGSY